MKATKTWVLVADAEHAKMYENLGPGKGLIELPDQMQKQTIPPTRDIGTDRPGRVHESVGGARGHTMARADWHDQAREDFAKTLGEHLNAAGLRNSYDRLILVAPPKTLGHLRNALTPHTAGFVTAEINKDIVQNTQAEIEHHIAEFLAI
jgi:protein required for attachment to host cells